MKHKILGKLALGALGAVAAAAIASPAFAWWDNSWSYRKPVTVDTAAAQIGGAEKAFPLLLRLDSANFRFEDAKPDGSDLRILAQDDKTPLAFHVERFDAKAGLGMVWVQLPELPANGQAKLYLYYGNKKAEGAGAAPRTFDAAYRAVFHFAGGATDATANGAQAQGPVSFAPGAIGEAARFTGQPLALAASSVGAVNPAEGFTFETWVKPEASPASSGDATLYKADGLVIGLTRGVPYVAIGDQKASAAGPIGDWSQVTVAADAKGATLYVNGAKAGTLTAPLPALTGAATLGEGLSGLMDEVRLSSAARDAAWVQASYASQGRGGRLVSFGADEKPSGQGFGYFGVIFKNVTLDAWVVIAVLALMSLVSWVVMYAKGAYVGRAARADRLFQAYYAQRKGEVLSSAWVKGLDDQSRRMLADSPLCRIYLAAVAEFDQAKAEDPRGVLAEETVAAIRASLDAQQVAESQTLSRWMVLLTIAISGGPFIGLLGTVLGVMITFAAIALAGDVNVNAIAPGVSAALLATVVGLLVAIPALFGYNYIASRNAEVSAGLQVFVDRLITRFADLHRRELRQQFKPAE